MHVVMRGLQYMAPSGRFTDKPDDAALFKDYATAENVIFGRADVIIRRLLPYRRCPHGIPFTSGIVAERLREELAANE